MNTALALTPLTLDSGSEAYAPGAYVQRPWGSWEILGMGAGYCIKRVCVDAGKRLSLQYHNHRAEHWVIVQGHAKIEIDGQIHLHGANEHIHIAPLTHHRIENIGLTELIFVETQIGDYLSESDIIRIEDDFGRK